MTGMFKFLINKQVINIGVSPQHFGIVGIHQDADFAFGVVFT